MTAALTPGDDLRVGIVGLGWFGQIHLDAWASVPGATVVGLCDTDAGALEPGRTRSQDGFHVAPGGPSASCGLEEVPVYRCLDDLLAAGVDLLDVVTSEDGHDACARQGLGAGADVVTEKPVTLALASTVDLFDLAARSERNLYVGHVLRFDPRFVTLAEEVRGRTLRHMSLARVFQPAAHQVYGRVHPGLNAAVHDVDLAVWLAGGPPRKVTTFASSFLCGRYPDTLDVVLEWDHGLRAVVHNSWHLAPSCPYGFVFDCRVEADGATHRVRNEPVVESWTDAGVAAPELFFWPRYGDARHGALVDELRHFAECARQGRPSDRVPTRDVVAVMRTIQAALDAEATGEPQYLTEPVHPAAGTHDG